MGECACHIAATGGDTYIANYLSGNVVKNCHVCVPHEGEGVNLPRQDMPHTHFAAFSLDKTRVFCCDLGLDGIFVYDRNLNEISRATVPAGYGVRHLVLTKDGRNVYAVNELVPSVTVFAFDGDRLIRKATATLPCEEKTSTAAGNPSVGGRKNAVRFRPRRKRPVRAGYFGRACRRKRHARRIAESRLRRNFPARFQSFRKISSVL